MLGGMGLLLLTDPLDGDDKLGIFSTICYVMHDD